MRLYISITKLCFYGIMVIQARKGSNSNMEEKLSLKDRMRLILPDWSFKTIKYLRDFFRLIRGNFYDFFRYLSFANLTGEPANEAQYFALLTANYHTIEKGLSLNSPKKMFGKAVIERILYLLDNYSALYGSNQSYHLSLNALQSYIDYHHKISIKNDFLDDLQVKVNHYKEVNKSKDFGGGFKFVSKDDILKNSQIDFNSFLFSRHSVRDFSNEPVDFSLIEQAVKMAQRTPSVCNRQTCKIHLYSKKEDIKKALNYQNGNRGFNHQIDKLAVVVSSVDHFMSSAERFQRWIEGGMFAMSFVYALHSLGLGSCCLNWSVNSFVDRAFRKNFDINGGDEIIMMLAIGNLPDTLKVCDSIRKDVDQVLINHSGV